MKNDNIGSVVVAVLLIALIFIVVTKTQSINDTAAKNRKAVIDSIRITTIELTAMVDSIEKALDYYIIEKHKQEVYELLKQDYYNTVANQANLDSCFQDGYLTALEDLGYIIERW